MVAGGGVMNSLFFVQFVVGALALVGFGVIVWALYEFFDNHVGDRFRDRHLGADLLAAREQGIMKTLRLKNVKPAGLYDRWVPGVTRRPTEL